MRVKKFVGQSIKDATEKMKTDLGPEAIILNSRKITKGGALNFLGKEIFEITAAIDEVPTGPRSTTYARPRAGDAFADSMAAAKNAAADESTVDSLKKMTERFEGRALHVPEHGAPGKRSAEAAELYELKSEVQDMKGKLGDIIEHLRHSRIPALPGQLQRVFTTLVERDVDEQLAAELVQAVYGGLSADQLENKKLAETGVLKAMADLVRPAGEAKQRRKRSKVIALVGPTGVGKTTTIAKLAAINKLFSHVDVALVSADTYRIGAIEQLRTFAAIADIPMEVVYQPSEMGAAIKKFHDKEIVFVDTVGRSQRSPEDLADLAKFVEAAGADEVHLVLSASTGLKTALEIIDQFKVVKPNRILFSKLDEAATLGPLLSIVHRKRLPVSYVTTGQTVPDDILQIRPDQFAAMIYAGEMAHA